MCFRSCSNHIYTVWLKWLIFGHSRTEEDPRGGGGARRQRRRRRRTWWISLWLQFPKTSIRLQAPPMPLSPELFIWRSVFISGLTPPLRLGRDAPFEAAGCRAWGDSFNSGCWRRVAHEWPMKHFLVALSLSVVMSLVKQWQHMGYLFTQA